MALKALINRQSKHASHESFRLAAIVDDTLTFHDSIR